MVYNMSLSIQVQPISTILIWGALGTTLLANLTGMGIFLIIEACLPTFISKIFEIDEI